VQQNEPKKAYNKVKLCSAVELLELDDCARAVLEHFQPNASRFDSIEAHNRLITFKIVHSWHSRVLNL
jgi:hypothetical protein